MDQVRRLSGRYEQCGLGGTSSGRFLRSIVTEGRMPRGRGVTWLQDLITKGDPTSVSPLVTEIKDLISRSPRADTVRTLESLLRTVVSGWDLSDHKKSELERLRKQVNDALPDLELDERDRYLLDGLNRKRLKLYTSNYWSRRPVISSRLDVIFGRWDAESKISPDDWEFVRENFESAVADFEGNRHPVGSLRWTRSGLPVTIMGEPQIDERGNTLIEVLTPHSVLSLDVQSLLIRAPK